MDTKREVGMRIRAIRKLRGLTQEGLAERIERSVEAVSNLERGKSLPGFETLERLSRFLDVQIRDFFDFRTDDDGGGEDAHHRELLTGLMRVARRLQTRDLAIALDQIKALAGRGPDGQR